MCPLETESEFQLTASERTWSATYQALQWGLVTELNWTRTHAALTTVLLLKRHTSTNSSSLIPSSTQTMFTAWVRSTRGFPELCWKHTAERCADEGRKWNLQWERTQLLLTTTRSQHWHTAQLCCLALWLCSPASQCFLTHNTKVQNHEPHSSSVTS